MNTDEPIMHEATERELTALLQNPPHGLGLIGDDGIGKTMLTRWIASRAVGKPVASLSKYSYFRLFQPTNNSLTIEQIRELNDFMKLKTVGAAPIRRVVTIEHADTMTIEAQNALLKTLEEPPADTLIILTIASKRNLLPTIISRLQTITVRIPNKAQLRALSGTSTEKFERAYRVSGGLPGLMHALLQDEAGHPLLEAINQARNLLQMSAFERLSQVDSVSKDKLQASELTQALLRMAEVGIAQAAAAHDEKSLRRWQRVLQATNTTQNALGANAQSKLAVTNLFLQL